MNDWMGLLMMLKVARSVIELKKEKKERKEKANENNELQIKVVIEKEGKGKKYSDNDLITIVGHAYEPFIARFVIYDRTIRVTFDASDAYAHGHATEGLTFVKEIEISEFLANG
uniref:DUF3127 domain-containing protein n=1 Tax=Romanomermis culicivorax TaxID=13658 RepID=A0A915HI71_ROMCU